MTLADLLAASPTAINSIDLLDAFAGALAELSLDTDPDIPAFTLDHRVDEVIAALEQSIQPAAPPPLRESPMPIISHIVDELGTGSSISDVLRSQQQYHEQRRWSVFEVIGDRSLTTFDDRDRAALWHAARAELTTQPAGIRLALDAAALAQELERTNPLGAQVAHVAAAWSARF